MPHNHRGYSSEFSPRSLSYAITFRVGIFDAGGALYVPTQSLECMYLHPINVVDVRLSKAHVSVSGELCANAPPSTDGHLAESLLA